MTFLIVIIDLMPFHVFLNCFEIASVRLPNIESGKILFVNIVD